MPLSEFEMEKIAQIVSGKVGGAMDAKQLRRVIDQVVDKMTARDQATPGRVEGATCEISGATARPSQPEPTPNRSNGTRSLSEGVADAIPEGGLYERLDKTHRTRIILAAFGYNRPGVIHALTHVLAENQCNLEDISQKIMREFFTLIMIVDITDSSVEFAQLVERVKATEEQVGMKVFMMHEDTFQYMHRI